MACACFFSLPCVCVPPLLHPGRTSRSRGDAPPQMRTCILPHMTTTPQKNIGHTNTSPPSSPPCYHHIHPSSLSSSPASQSPSFAHNSATVPLNKLPCSTSQACRAVPLLFPHLLYSCPSHLLRPAAGCPDQSSHQRRTLVFFFFPKPCRPWSQGRSPTISIRLGITNPRRRQENGPFWRMNHYYRCKVLVSAF